ncbi:MAG: hypothetical protein HZB16_05860 [Armatimonadetes bacterium]|nr:hypothetical protein [Armatimonadota bacterium]
MARLWGEFDPARASGATAALTNPLLRAVGRAAAMEFARWPRPDVAAALARAEADYLAAPQRSALDDATRAAVVDAIALAWCRHDADQLPAVHARLTLREGAALGLWRAQLEQTAARTPLWPPEHLLSPGSVRRVLFEVDWALTENRRLRACLTLATRVRREELAS